MKLICSNDVCKYNEHCRDCVYDGTLVLNDDGECESFLHYKEAPEYKTFYYKACVIDGVAFKRTARGREIVCNGFTLYYEAKELTPETWCTEKISGMGAELKRFQSDLTANRIRLLIESKPYNNVNDLPFQGEKAIDSAGDRS